MEKETVLFLVGLVVGGIVGGLLAWARAKAGLHAAATAEREARIRAEAQRAEAEKNLAEQRKLLEEARTRLADTFKALSSDALRSNTQHFRQQAEDVVKPLHESLKLYEQHVKELEASRQSAYGSIKEQIKSLTATQEALQKETGNLVSALRKPEVRGRWGEMTLRRVVEVAGMSGHCDFEEQVHTKSEEGGLRPDMVVRLPADREIVVDAKVSLEAYLDAISAESEEQRSQQMNRHARQMRTHMTQLASKSYWEQFDKAPEFVVMFIPGESFFAAAVDSDPALIEDSMEKRVVLATPTTLIALLRSVAYGWRQERIAENALAISELGRQLYERMRTLAEHLAGVGKNLGRAGEAYNKAVGSMESRVFPAARKFKELGAAQGDDIPTVEPLETTPRQLNVPEQEKEEDESA